ncbi:hypothetical protein K503DRAFT_869601 [Rhizopogon vinicolor AM-OR11-026]|uniref:Uncharacterized protein n=1 Tax=Rhizopogon vinicolor AM-OR11-026 TaxID=1314800 RepID=A0A1B7ML71_9AGAM|nr:hypothetical protein K503DRAFT_869601 [Rhizopogon vinicolor AM-OR11-026]
MFARLSTALLYVLLVLAATAVATPNPTKLARNLVTSLLEPDLTHVIGTWLQSMSCYKP